VLPLSFTPYTKGVRLKQPFAETSDILLREAEFQEESLGLVGQGLSRIFLELLDRVAGPPLADQKP